MTTTMTTDYWIPDLKAASFDSPMSKASAFLEDDLDGIAAISFDNKPAASQHAFQYHLPLRKSTNATQSSRSDGKNDAITTKVPSWTADEDKNANSQDFVRIKKQRRTTTKDCWKK